MITIEMTERINSICVALYNQPQWYRQFVAKGIEVSDYEQEYYEYLLVQDRKNPGYGEYLHTMPGILYHSIKQRGLDLLKRRSAEILGYADDPDKTLNFRQYVYSRQCRGPAAEYAVKVSTQKIARAVGMLDRKDRAILEMRFYCSMPPRMIAAKLNKPVRYVYSSIERSKRSLAVNGVANELKHWYAVLLGNQVLDGNG